MTDLRRPRQAWFAVTIEYDHGAILASDVEMALEALGGPDHEVKATVVFVSEDMHDRLRAVATEPWSEEYQTVDEAAAAGDESAREAIGYSSERFLKTEELAKAAFALQEIRYRADRLLTAVDTSAQTADLPATHTLKINAEELRRVLPEKTDEPEETEVVVIAIDWAKPNVIATFGDRAAAERYREAMDGAGLRCIVQRRAKGSSDGV